MNICVVGLGHVGCVSAACLAADGHNVTGVDIHRTIVDCINGGQSPIREPDLERILQDGRRQGRLWATVNILEALDDSDMIQVCVGTPENPDGLPDLSILERACRDIGQRLSVSRKRRIVVVRSTILPGSTRNTVIPVVERSSRKAAGIDFGVCFHPDFSREGTAVADYYSPPKIVVGALCRPDAEALMSLYDRISAPRFITDLEAAEMVKYADNSFHALKICFANEIGSLCRGLGVDSQEVMSIFKSDTKLNLSGLYLRPGLAFGGPCLPKDIKAITRKAESLNLRVPLLSSILESNEAHLYRCSRMILDSGKKKIGILGISPKIGSDDLRASPLVSLVEALYAQGCDLKIFDRDIDPAILIGANREFLDTHADSFLRFFAKDLAEVIDFAELLVVAKSSEEFDTAVQGLGGKKTVMNLDSAQTRYSGSCR